jgi:triacylglycerol lipase
MEKHTIILAHGILGFGSVPGMSFVNYFNGVALHLTNQGHVVIAPSVNAIGSVAERGEQLAAAILQTPLEEQEHLHVIAHSMGGLDARHALSNIERDDVSKRVAERVKTLVTIGTPHRGSPVADAIADRTDPLFAEIPAFLVEAFRNNAGGLDDLTTKACIQFDETTPDADGVTYIEVAGDASQGGQELFLFHLAAAIGRLSDEVNDGVVTRSSALRNGHKHLDDWPVDHAGEIGWSVATPLPILFDLPFLPHFARYDAIVAML